MNWKTKYVLAAAAFLPFFCGAEPEECGWPVMRTYEGRNTARIRMPQGGIGTGSISVSGRGELVDWEIRNRPEKNRTPNRGKWGSGFILRCVTPDGKIRARLMEGPLDAGQDYVGEPINHGMPRFSTGAFKTAYPFAQLVMTDPKMPVRVTLETYNPFMQGDSEKSGIPAVLMRYRVTNLTDMPLETGVAAQLMVPADGGTNAFSFCRAPGCRGVKMVETRPRPDEKRGELVLMAPDDETPCTHALRFDCDSWGVEKSHCWNRFFNSGDIVDHRVTDGKHDEHPLAMMTLAKRIPPHGTVTYPFAVAWRYPDMFAWGRKDGKPCCLGNYYAEAYPTAESAASDLLVHTAAYERRTAEFVRSVTEAAGVPEVVKEAALFNLAMLKSTTCFRTPDGRFYGWEGSFDDSGSCYGSCTHVWGYEHALVDVWPDLARSMLETQFGPALDERGHMAFRVRLPLEAKAGEDTIDCADGHCQCLVKACEYWKRTGDDAWLRRMWPKIRLATEFCWIEKGWDGDCDGVMEGCQHNTMDVEYFGPNPQMEFLYLAALEAVAAMAERAEDPSFAEKCRDLLVRGSAWTEKNLFNGRYYEQKVVPPLSTNAIARGLRTDMGAKNLENPEFQLANGCLIDQLLGDFSARSCGLKPVVDAEHGKKTLESVVKLCRKAPDDDLFNNMRGFVYAGETSLRMAWYDESNMPAVPFPYYRETMTGFEYVVAALLAWNGERAEAERVVRDIRDRYDGYKRNPFNEPECGNHYARTLAAWTVFKAFLR